MLRFRPISRPRASSSWLIRVFIRENPWQILLDSSLTDAQVLVLRLLSLLTSRHTRTHSQPQKRQRPHRFKLLIKQLEFAGITFDDLGRRRTWLRFIKHDIRNRNRKICDSVAV